MFRVYWVCYIVLQANGDPRDAEIISVARALLEKRAALLPPDLRRPFLENIAIHRLIAGAGEA
jgi:hypothetical protein